MTVALMSSRLEAFAQLFTLLIVFIFVLAATYFATRLLVITRRISFPEVIYRY